MNLWDLLRKLPEKRVEKYIQSNVWSNANERGLPWVEAISDPIALRSAAQSLNEQTVLVLAAMLHLFGASPVNEEHLLGGVRRQTKLSGAECRAGLQQLEEAGILFVVRKVWGERICFMPAQCFIAWQQLLSPCPIQPRTSVINRYLESSLNVRKSIPSFGKQLLHAFSALAMSEMTFTTKGVLAKKTISKLEQAIVLDEKWLRPFGLKFSHHEHYSMKAALVLEAGQSLGLLRRAEGALSWDLNLLAAWLSQNDALREQSLREWCLSLLMPEASAEAAHAAAALCGLTSGQWYSDHDMEQWLTSSRLGQELIDEPRSALGKPGADWYELLYSLGWLELAERDRTAGVEGERLFRWKIGFPAESHFIAIQPNGEIYAGPGCSFAVRWELELFTERVNDEEMTLYRMTKVSIVRALENGRTLASITLFLRRASGCQELPPTVEDLLEEWTSRACRSKFDEVILLRFDNDEVANIVKQQQAIAPMLLEQIGTTNFIVEKGNISELRRMLERIGYPPRKGIASETDHTNAIYPAMALQSDSETVDKNFKRANRSADESHPNMPFIYSQQSLQHYELSDIRDHAWSLHLPELERVPAMWLKDLRAYHHSTRKELIEQALQWEIPVQLCIQDQPRSFVPERLEQQDDGWAVVGVLENADERSHVRLTPDMWEEMMLIIPT